MSQDLYVEVMVALGVALGVALTLQKNPFQEVTLKPSQLGGLSKNLIKPTLLYFIKI